MNAYIGQYQIVSNPMHALEMAEDKPSQPQDDDVDDEDRISKLPDCLLVEILSHLPETKYAIRTGTLSKRWEHIWTRVHSLVFINPIFGSATDFFSLVDRTLAQRRTSKLKKFKFHYLHNYRFESRVNNWIHYAINCNVEELDLAFWDLGFETMFPLDQLFFVNSCFKDLRLALCMFNPTGAITWKNLRSLCITYGKLDEATIENILSGSPVLETLELEGCYGYTRIDITSKSVKKLVFIVYMNIHHRPENDIIEINAPNILSLTVRRHMWLGKLLLLNVSSLVEAELDYPKLSTRLLYLGDRKEAEEEMLKAFILNLVHVKDIRIGVYCFNVLDRLKAKGFRSPTNLKALIKKSGWKNVLGGPM